MIIILDPGSTHMGKLEYAIELVDLAVSAGADYIKWQLGTDKPNVPFNLEWWPFLKDRCGDKIGMFASFFNTESFDFLMEQKVPYIKFAYSQNHRNILMDRCVKAGQKMIVSCDFMTKNIPTEAVRLFCIPEYPVPYQVCFDGIFDRFDGFSDHTVGYRQSFSAMKEGAEYLEKHFTIDHDDVDCPDSRFAMSPAETHTMIRLMNGDI